MTDYQVQRLSDRPEKASELFGLIEKVFPRGGPLPQSVSIENEFPLLLQKSNWSRVFFIEQDGKVVSSASFKLFEHFISRSSPLPLVTAGIGLVVTHPKYQKKGLGFAIQNAIEQAAENSGALLTVLWSDQVRFYSKLGYIVAGTELNWSLDRNELSLLGTRLNQELGESEYIFERLSDFSRVQSLYQGFSRGPRRHKEDFSVMERILSLPNTYGILAIDKNSKDVKGYGILGKGRDLRDTLHEFIAQPKAIAPLLKEFVKYCASGLRLQQPLGSPLKDEISHWLGLETKQALSFMKVLNGPRLAEWISRSGLLPPGFGLVSSEKSFRLLNRHTVFYESPDFGHLVQLFFGPWEVTELEGLPQTMMELASDFPKPFPLYFWGLDSV